MNGYKGIKGAVGRGTGKPRMERQRVYGEENLHSSTSCFMILVSPSVCLSFPISKMRMLNAAYLRVVVRI